MATGAIKATRSGRVTRPTKRAQGGTVAARGRTFAHTTHHPGTAVVPQESAGALGEAYRGKWADNDAVTKGWIFRALADPVIHAAANFNNVGTGPELVICGFFLSRDYHTSGANANLFFQSQKLLISDRSRVKLLKKFVVDIAIDNPFGGLIYLNIDGAYFHTRTELQEFKDAARDRGLLQGGRVLDVPDTMTYQATTLVAFFEREGVI
jgi:hypothetical protein